MPFDDKEIRAALTLNRIPSFTVGGEAKADVLSFKLHLRGVNYSELRHHPHSHTYFEHHFSGAESMTLLLESGRAVIVPPFCSVLIVPGCVHGWAKETVCERHYSISYEFKDHAVTEYILSAAAKEPFLLFNENAAIRFCLSYIPNAMQREHDEALHLMQSLSAIIFNEILDSIRRRTSFPLRSYLSPSRVQLAKTYIKEHICDRPTVEEVAAKVHLSVKQLDRLFGKEEGITATEYIRDRLCIEAESRLLSRKETIQQISMDLGFPSPSAFSKFFALHRGLSPKVFRELHGSAPNE